jgi:hypothetical protein
VKNYVSSYGILGNDISDVQSGTTGTYIVSAFNTEDAFVAVDSAWQKLTAAFGPTIIDLNIQANQDEFTFETTDPEVFYAVVKYVGISYTVANPVISTTGQTPVDPNALTSFPPLNQGGEPLHDSTVRAAIRRAKSYEATINKYISFYSNIFPGIATAEIEAIICQESQGVDQTSPRGARGLMQVEPDTARDLAKKDGRTFNVAELNNTDSQIKYGVEYYAGLLRQFSGNRQLAWGAYNSGPNVKYKGKKVYNEGLIAGNKETINYVRAIPWWIGLIQQTT